MIKLVFVASCLLLYLQGFSQKKIRSSSKPTRIKTTDISLKARLAFYPFNKATQVKIVSFDVTLDSSTYQEKPYYKPPRLRYKIPVDNDTVNYNRLSQIVTLNFKQVDTLTDILFNECSRGTEWELNPAFTSMPHNAVLFIDKEGKVFEYIELCIDCSRIRYSSNKIIPYKLCDYAFQALQSFFRRNGLKADVYSFKGLNSR